MTVSASVGRDPTIGETIALAYKTIGVVEISQQPSEAQRTFAKQLLERILDDLDMYGVQARAVELRNITLTAGTRAYQMAADVLDVMGDAKYIAAAEADPDAATGETLVKQLTLAEWQLLSGRSSEGTPTMYWVDRATDPPTVNLWVIPDEAGTVRLQVIKHLADADDENATFDLERYWHGYLLDSLCAKLCPSTIGLAAAREFESAAKRNLALCVKRADETPSMQATMDHRGPYG